MPFQESIRRHLLKLDDAEKKVADAYRMIAEERRRLLTILCRGDEAVEAKNENSGPDSPEPPLLM